jgi:putative selenate reductase
MIKGGKVSIERVSTKNITQKYQILNIADFCNECGNCTTFCPTNGAPYRDKPKFYLTAKSFKEVENGFMLSKLKDKTVLLHKQQNEISTLTFKDDQYIFESEAVKGTFNKSTFELNKAEFLKNDLKEFEFLQAVNMFLLFDAAKNLY